VQGMMIVEKTDKDDFEPYERGHCPKCGHTKFLRTMVDLIEISRMVIVKDVSYEDEHLGEEECSFECNKCGFKFHDAGELKFSEQKKESLP